MDYHKGRKIWLMTWYHLIASIISIHTCWNIIAKRRINLSFSILANMSEIILEIEGMVEDGPL